MFSGLRVVTCHCGGTEDRGSTALPSTKSSYTTRNEETQEQRPRHKDVFERDSYGQPCVSGLLSLSVLARSVQCRRKTLERRKEGFTTCGCA